MKSKEKTEDIRLIDKVAFVGGVAGVVALVPVFLGEPPSTIWKLLIVTVLLGSIVFVSHRFCLLLVVQAHRFLSQLVPWAVVLTVFNTAIIFSYVRKSPSVRVVRFVNGALFNSYENVGSLHNRFITAYGNDQNKLEWLVEDGQRSGAFSYTTDRNSIPTSFESSGGYIVFYDHPIDKLQCEELSFECKSLTSTGRADVGVRLAVDNPRATGDRELICYEFPSLASLANLDESWKEFRIPLRQFHETVRRPPFPEGLDANSINKIVFFVNVTVATNCPKATLWFRDIHIR
jgi:hypothetical protein